MKRETNIAGKDGAVAAGVPSHDEIAARAYQVYLERGCQHGHDMDDWLQAEYELLQLPVDKLAKVKTPQTTGRKPSHRSVVEVVRSVLY